ncbi:hypothetical protein I317_04713 [Kwoniella heveanensis CBS 569]|uniref:Uncharacterized protein n=1 Tax=Kwoniella heveanensis BCC8398 TaxID=1296120 RepID=A0A1B9GHX2_9TREE|nr:hypothetical protein I316_07746 [Kwoniella heveanensis BCC8398]OCF41510.1 hypothetical protein I317_04713 [Kwoniella heveanensis CBS 569]
MSTRATVSALRAMRPTHIRSLTTSRLALSSSSSTDLPPTPNSAEALGFKPQANRQRQLPLDLKINIPATGKQDLFTSRQRLQREKRQEMTFSLNPTKKSTGSDTQTTEDFFADSDLSSSSAPSKSARNDNQSTSSSAAPRSRRALKGVSMDVVSDSSALPPDVIRRQRQRRDRVRATGASQGGQDRKGRAGGQQQQKPRERKRRDAPAREKRALQPRRQLTFETMDHSEQGLFGKRSLVNESVITAGSAGLGHARHAASVRQSISESPFPSNPLPILSPAPSKSSEQAVQIASWLAALNGSIQAGAKSELSDTVAAQLKR